MVRQLKKTDQPNYDKPVPLEPLPAVKSSADGQIKNLVDHINVLEEKLKSIEQRLKVKDDQFNQINREKDGLERMLRTMRESFTQQHVQPREETKSQVSSSKIQEIEPAKEIKLPRFRWPSTQKIKKVFIAVVVLGVALTGVKLIWNVGHPPYNASMVLKLRAKDFKTDLITIDVNTEYEVKVLQTTGIRTQVMAQTLEWPAFITKQRWLMYPVSIFYARLYDCRLGKAKNTIVISAWGQKKESARELVNAVESAYRLSYQRRRKAQLINAHKQLVGQVNTHKNKIADNIKQINSVETKNQIMGVTQSVKRKLDVLVNTRALELEKDLALMKSQYQTVQLSLDSLKKSGKLDFIDNQDKGNMAFLEALRLKLKTMELKKLLIPQNSLSSYEEGIKDIKRRIATLISDWADRAKVPSGQESVYIKGVFIRAKLEALNMLLNRQYAVSDSLNGEALKYYQARVDMDKVFVKLENLLNVSDVVEVTINKPLDKEVIIDTPVLIVKK